MEVHSVVSVRFGCGPSIVLWVMGGEAVCLAEWCFRAFFWHLSLSVVAAREHLWRSSLRGVGGDSVEAVFLLGRSAQ